MGPILQRIFWALLEGLTASALLVAGGRQALTALQAMSIATGLIYTILICIVCLALWRAMQVEAGDIDPFGPSFVIDILDPFFTDPLDEVLSKAVFTSKLFSQFLGNIILAPLTVAKTSARVWGPSSFIPILLCLLVMFIVHRSSCSPVSCRRMLGSSFGFLHRFWISSLNGLD